MTTFMPQGFNFLGGPSVIPPQGGGFSFPTIPGTNVPNPADALTQFFPQIQMGQPQGRQPGESITDYVNRINSTRDAVQANATGFGVSGNDREQLGIGLFNNAANFLDQNPQLFEPFGGQFTAGNTGLQDQARANLGNFLGGNPFGLQNQAAQVAGGVSQFNPASVAGGLVGAQNVSGGSLLGGPGIGAFQNPFTDQVVNTALNDIERARQIANESGAQSAGAGTFGGDRNAIIEAETNRAFADQSARTAAQLRSAGFDTAASLFNQDLSRGLTANLANQSAALNAGLANQSTGLQAQLANQRAGLQGAGLNLSAAGQLGGLGSGLFNQNLLGASALNQFGTQDQATNQAELNAQFNEFLRTQNAPLQGFNFLSGILNGVPFVPQPQGPGAAAGFLGGAATGAGIGSAIPGVGTLAGALGGGLLGLFA